MSTRLLSLFAALSLAPLGACVVVTDDGTHLGGSGQSEIPTGLSAYQIDVGAGVIIQPGSQAGYGITTGGGGSYRLVDTGDANSSDMLREFYGSVWTTGTFSDIAPGCSNNSCPLESNDTLSAPVDVAGGGQRIDFDFITSTGIDGFDFTTSVEPIYFDLYIDGTHRPDLVFFSSQGAQATAGMEDPFALQSVVTN